MRRNLRRQRGFTLIELMMASIISFLLAMVCISLTRQSADLNSGLKARLRLNAQARQAFGVIADGGALPSGTTGTDGTRNIYGLHGRYGAQTGASLRQNYRLTLSSNGNQAAGDSFASKTVTCTGAGTPLPDCTAAGTAMTVNGWLGADPTVNQTNRSISGPTVTNNTVEATITLTDPYRAVHAKLPANATDTYRNIFTANRDSKVNSTTADY